MTMPDQIFINIALLAVGVAIGALLGETSRQQHDRQLFREYINFMTESEHNNELLFREVPVQDMEFTFVYDPAMVEAALHPPDSGQEQPFGAEKVL